MDDVYYKIRLINNDVFYVIKSVINQCKQVQEVNDYFLLNQSIVNSDPCDRFFKQEMGLPIYIHLK